MARSEQAVFVNMCMVTDGDHVLVIDRKKPDWPGVTFCGTKQFQEDADTRYVVLFYKANRFTGELKSSDEGEVFWINRNDLTNYPLALEMEAMVQVIESDCLSEFYYYKEKGSWKYKLL